MAPLTAFIFLLLQCIVIANAGWVQETWSITSLTTHFMGKNSGLADGKWPPDSGFPTTANFVLRQGFEEGPAVNGIFRKSAAVRHNDIKCGATWMPDPPKNSPASARPMPTDWVMCDEGRNGSAGFQFRFKKGSVSPANPTSFLLEIERVGINNSWIVPYATDVDAPKNGNITNPYGSLTCAGGPPLSGIHCHLEGQITKYGYTETKPAIIVKNESSPVTSFRRRQDLVLSDGLHTSPIQFTTNIYPSIAYCTNLLNFYVDDVHTSAHCQYIWGCEYWGKFESGKVHHCNNPRYSFTISSPQFNHTMQPEYLLMNSFHIDVTNTTCISGRKFAVTSGIDLDLTTKEWGKCDDRDCVYIIGDLEDAFPITRKEILGPC